MPEFKKGKVSKTVVLKNKQAHDFSAASVKTEDKQSKSCFHCDKERGSQTGDDGKA